MPASDLPELLALLRDYQAGPRPGPEYIGLAQARDLIDLLMAQTADAVVESGEWDDDGYLAGPLQRALRDRQARRRASIGGPKSGLGRSIRPLRIRTGL